MGKSMAELFAKSGDKVYIVGRRKEELDKVASSLSEYKVHPVLADLTDPKAVESIVEAVHKDNTVVDVLINCAGGSANVADGLSLEAAMSAWKAGIDQNLSSAFLMIYAFKSMLARPGGRIINITSLAAFSGSSRVGGEVYAAAKAGLHGMTRSFVKEFAPQGITINCVAPGLIGHTEFFGPNGIEKSRLDKALTGIPAGRIGEPEEVAHAVFYLASEEAGFISGDILNVNGGAQFSR